MKEWLLKNTKLTEEEYTKYINPNLLIIDGKTTTHKYEEYNLFESPIIGIDKFTQKKSNIIRRKKYKVIKEANYYIHQNIKFYILAEAAKHMSKILYSEKRYHKCAKLSLEILYQFQNNSCRIITALCKNPFNKYKEHFLHTFLIYTSKSNEEYIIDSTINAIIPKEQYIKLFNAKIISDIPKETAINDIKILKNQHDITVQEYLCFRDKIIPHIKKLKKSISN